MNIVHPPAAGRLRLAALLLFLSSFGCSGTDDDGTNYSSSPASGGADMSTGGDDSGGTTPGSGGAMGSASGGEGSGGMNGSGGSPDAIEGVAHVFTASTEGTVRAYVMSEVDGSLTAAGFYDTGGLNFATLGPRVSSTDETRDVFVTSNNQVTALKYDPSTQSFSAGALAITAGGGTHVTVTNTGDAVAVAHYSENTVSFLPFFRSGGFGIEQTELPGDNAHQARVRGQMLYVPCLGSNHVAQYQVAIAPDSASTLLELDPPNVSVPGGPRHLDFHPTEPVAYALSELSSQVHVLDISATGALTLRAGGSVASHVDGGSHTSSDIKVTPSGRTLFVVNRAPSEIVRFEIQADSSVVRQESVALTGEVRSFGMDPKGAFLQVGSKAGILQTFAINAVTGVLTEGPSLSDLGTINNTEVHYLVVAP